MLRAEDIARARTFYTEVLGLKAMEASGPSSEGMYTAGDGTMVMIYERPGMPAPQNTTLGFGVAVDKFDEVIADLRGQGRGLRGLRPARYRAEDRRMASASYDGAKVAWFKDTEGNIINIASM